MSVTRLGEFRAAPNQTEALGNFLKTIMPLIRVSAGNVSCQLLQDQEDPSKFVMIEMWETVEAHQASAKNIPPELLGQIRPLLGAPPQGKYLVEQ